MLERRMYERVKLRCTVTLWDPQSGEVTRVITENISSHGFYALSPTIYAPGTRLQAVLELPSNNSDEKSGRAASSICCQVRVVRIESSNTDSGVGIGFEIETYVVSSNS